ncbi:hypothetical protein EW026_g2809 [Hermanssonia centrifuga]|uniref:Ferritin-like domain-containing protein n=1 Tax=Hermanssonia centrifuga TaxID=98765 RepID=A0A4S4KRQ8_9APHY|nr:hypothetical protein EW026_g2809 [Hermanssonia centrifuga]
MRFSATFIALAAPFLCSALPVKRAANPTDLLVLKFADVLEQLETQFYTQALAKFQASDFTAAGFSDVQVPIQQFQAIQSDEATHDSILQSTIQSLGDQPITTCQFNFDSVLTDVATMAATARVVENLGVAAYLGAAHLVSDPVLLTAAASILTVEARHQTVLNILNGGSAIPSAFDIPFNPSEVLAVASPFISGCDVGVVANPTLSITNTGTVAPDSFLPMMFGNSSFSLALPFNQCVVPPGTNGPVAVYVTSDDQPLENNIRDQATVNLIAGPTMAYIDTIVEDLGTVARTGSSSGSSSSSDSSSSSSSSDSSSSVSSSDSSSSSSTATASISLGTSTSTTTISPADASSIIASAASASATASDSASAAATGTDSAAPAATSAANNSAAGSTQDVQTPGGPNLYTGPSGDGTLQILGWSNVPAPASA